MTPQRVRDFGFFIEHEFTAIVHDTLDVVALRDAPARIVTHARTPPHCGRRSRNRPTNTCPSRYLVRQGIGSYVVGMAESTEEAPGTATVARLRRELARGTTELAVLSVLSVRRRYGYELLKVLREAGEGVLEVKEGTLYPLLHRLEDSGHILATWEAEGRARPRKYYVITPDGRTYLGMLRAEWTGLVDGMRHLLDTLGEVRE